MSLPHLHVALRKGALLAVFGGKKGQKDQASIPGPLDFGSSPTASAFKNKCQEVERLQGQIADAYAAFVDHDERTVRTRTSKRKRATKSLSHKIKELANTLKEKVAGHPHCIEEMHLERIELEDTQEQKTLS